MADRPCFTASITLSATPSTALRPKPTVIVCSGLVCGEAGGGQGGLDHRREIAVGPDVPHARPGDQPAGEDAALVAFRAASGCSWSSSGSAPGKASNSLA